MVYINSSPLFRRHTNWAWFSVLMQRAGKRGVDGSNPLSGASDFFSSALFFFVSFLYICIHIHIQVMTVTVTAKICRECPYNCYRNKFRGKLSLLYLVISGKASQIGFCGETSSLIRVDDNTGPCDYSLGN